MTESDESSNNPKPCTYWGFVGSGCLGLLSVVVLGVLCCVDPHHKLKPPVIEVFQRKYRTPETENAASEEDAGVFCWGAMVEKYPKGEKMIYASGANAAEAEDKLRKKTKVFEAAFERSVKTSADEWNDVWAEYGSDIVEKCEAWKKEESDYKKDRVGSGPDAADDDDDDDVDDDAGLDDLHNPSKSGSSDESEKWRKLLDFAAQLPIAPLARDMLRELLPHPTRFQLIFLDYPNDRENILRDCNDFVERKAKYDKEAYGASVYLIVSVLALCGFYACFMFGQRYKAELEEQRMLDDSDSDDDDFDAPDPVPVYLQPVQGPQGGDQVQNPWLQNPPPVQPSSPPPKPNEGGAMLV